MITHKYNTADELHKLVRELHTYSTESRVQLEQIKERLDKLEEEVESQSRQLTWYEFLIKATKALLAVLLVLVTLRWGDLAQAVRDAVVK